MSLYRGFNTIDRDMGPYLLKDSALVIRDLLNHFSISKGEKLMNPAFGSIIWLSLFEPLTPALRDDLRKDVERICSYDPRIKRLNQVVVTEYEHGLSLGVSITLVTSNKALELSMLFDRETSRFRVSIL